MTFPLYLETLSTPIGVLLIFTHEDGALWAIEFERGETAPEAPDPAQAKDLRRRQDQSEARRALYAYFAGDLEAASRPIPLAARGTAFQHTVWRALREIPAGRTLSYAELARRIGKPGAARAVGGANGANPFAILVPCHRVIAADGGLGGYSSGLARKRWLLRHEGFTVHGDRVLRP